MIVKIFIISFLSSFVVLSYQPGTVNKKYQGIDQQKAEGYTAFHIGNRFSDCDIGVRQRHNINNGFQDKRYFIDREKSPAEESHRHNQKIGIRGGVFMRLGPHSDDHAQIGEKKTVQQQRNHKKTGNGKVIGGNESDNNDQRGSKKPFWPCPPRTSPAMMAEGRIAPG